MKTKLHLTVDLQYPNSRGTRNHDIIIQSDFEMPTDMLIMSKRFSLSLGTDHPNFLKQVWIPIDNLEFSIGLENDPQPNCVHLSHTLVIDDHKKGLELHRCFISDKRFFVQGWKAKPYEWFRA